MEEEGAGCTVAAVPSDEEGEVVGNSVAAAEVGPSARRLLWNCVLMSGCFAWAEGALTAILAVSASLIDRDLNANAGLILYANFAVGALIAPAITACLGLKLSLVFGLIGFSLFAGSFVYPVASVMYPAAALSGLMGAVLWTAQGAYLTINATLYTDARAASPPASPDSGVGTRVAGVVAALAGEAGALKRSVGFMSGIFATVFPLALTTCKLLASVVLAADPPNAVTWLYACYTLVAACSAVGMAFVFPLGGGPVRPRKAFRHTRKHLAATARALTDTRMLLLVPTNICFGLVAGFFPCVMTPLASDTHGKEIVGYLYATAGAASFVLAPVYAHLSNHLLMGRTLVLMWGACNYIAVVGVLSFHRPTTAFSLYVLWAVYGSATTVWQGTCMAMFADYFRDDAAAAFANLKLHSGAATFVAYAVFPHWGSVEVNARWCFAAALLSLVCAGGVAVVHGRYTACGDPLPSPRRCSSGTSSVCTAANDNLPEGGDDDAGVEAHALTSPLRPGSMRTPTAVTP